MRSIRLFLMFLMLASLGGCGRASAPLSANQDITPPTEYILDIGDEISITIYNERDLSGKYVLDSRGFVTLPLIEAVRLAGLNIPDAQDLVATLYEDGYLIAPQVSIQVETFRPFFVLGEVNRPGKYEYANGLMLQNAIAMSGGFTYRARESRLVIQRGGEKIVVSNDQIINFPLTPGDIIHVDERFF